METLCEKNVPKGPKYGSFPLFENGAKVFAASFSNKTVSERNITFLASKNLRRLFFGAKIFCVPLAGFLLAYNFCP